MFGDPAGKAKQGVGWLLVPVSSSLLFHGSCVVGTYIITQLQQEANLDSGRGWAIHPFLLGHLVPVISLLEVWLSPCKAGQCWALQNWARHGSGRYPPLVEWP